MMIHNLYEVYEEDVVRLSPYNLLRIPQQKEQATLYTNTAFLNNGGAK